MGHMAQDGKKDDYMESELAREILNHLPDADVESLSIDSSSVCIFWKDRERRFVGANQAFLNFHGKTLRN